MTNIERAEQLERMAAKMRLKAGFSREWAARPRVRNVQQNLDEAKRRDADAELFDAAAQALRLVGSATDSSNAERSVEWAGAQDKHTIASPEITRERVIAAGHQAHAEAWRTLPRDGDFDRNVERARQFAAAREALLIAFDRIVYKTIAADCSLLKPCRRETCRCSQPLDLGSPVDALRALLAELALHAQEHTDDDAAGRDRDSNDRAHVPLNVQPVRQAVPVETVRVCSHVGSDCVDHPGQAPASPQAQAVALPPEIQALLKECDDEARFEALNFREERLRDALRASATAQQQAEQRFERLVEQLQNPHAVYVMMLRGEVARNTLDRAEQAEQAREALKAIRDAAFNVVMQWGSGTEADTRTAILELEGLFNAKD